MNRKLVMFSLVLFGIGTVTPFFFLLNNPGSNKPYIFFTLTLVIIILAVLVFAATIYYKIILIEKNFYASYLRKSFSYSAKKILIALYLFSIGFFAILNFSDTLMSHSQKMVHSNYVTKFEEKIREIHSIATPSEIDVLKKRIEGQNCMDHQDAICMLLDDIVNGLNKEEILLFANISEVNEILSTSTQSGKELNKYWYFFVFGPAVLMLILYSIIETPIFLAKRNLSKEEELSIA